MNKKLKFILIAIIIIILVLIFALLTSKQVRKFASMQYLSSQQLEKGIYHHVYDYNWNTNKGTMIIRVADPENGIDTLTCPDGAVINCYGKTQIAVDYEIENNNKYKFLAITKAGETIEEEIIIDASTVDELITFSVTEENTKINIDIDYNEYKNKYYKFAENGEWIEYSETISILAEEIVKQSGYDEINKTSTIYLRGADDLGNEVIIKKQIPILAEMPKVNLIFRNAENSVDIDAIKQQIKDELAKNNISAGLMEVAIGGEQTIQSEGEDAETIFNTWGRIGYTGKWYYDSSAKTIVNSENTNNYTGFYYSQEMGYTDIELEYDNMSTNRDDDMMGSMIRFNKNANGTVTTYIFALDKHDNGGGISSGRYNGLLKIVGKNFQHSSVTVLQRINKTWTRNTWTNYKITAKENNIKVYINDELVIDYTDNSNPILTGSYGFFSYSQPYAMYKNITGKGFKYYSLEELVQENTWDKDSNCIINVNYGEEELTADLANNMSTNGIHYIGVTVPEQQSPTEQFITLNQNNGTYINAQDEQYIANIIEYIKSII